MTPDEYKNRSENLPRITFNWISLIENGHNLTKDFQCLLNKSYFVVIYCV